MFSCSRRALLQFGFGCTYFIAVCTEMEERYAYVQKHREAAAVEQVLVADFQAVDVVVRTFHTDFGQEFAAVQLHLLLGDGHLLVQYGIFGAAEMSAVCSRMSCATSGKVSAVRISAVSGLPM